MAYEHSWDRKPCARCGYVRRVKVTKHTPPVQGNGTQEPPSFSWARLCKACDYDERAESHELAAQRFRSKASEERRRRAHKIAREGE